MGLKDFFKKETSEDYNNIIDRLAEDFKKTPNEATAKAFFKCLAKCDIYVPVLASSLVKDSDTIMYPYFERFVDKLYVTAYSTEEKCLENINEKYVPYKMNISECMYLLSNLEKLNVKRIMYNMNSDQIIINEAYIKYLQLITKRRLF